MCFMSACPGNVEMVCGKVKIWPDEGATRKVRGHQDNSDSPSEEQEYPQHVLYQSVG